MPPSVVKKPISVPKKYITFKVVVEMTLSEDDVQELCQNEKRLTKEQLRWIFQSLKEAEDTDEDKVLEVEGKKHKEPRDSVRERILDELDNLNTEVKCYDCGKLNDPHTDEGLWDRCSGGDTYKCYSCCNPAEAEEEDEEEVDDGEGSDKS